ncbi:MAG: metal-sulfur cluster assembly factor [Deltaproteobacteria bacterium]|nr:metal-sulfur cluster assembly factor [Deltaproteobacteria bacterium]
MINEAEIWEALRQVIDPEIGVNVVDLGLVYGVEASGDAVSVKMTMTTQACPLHAYLTESAEQAIKRCLPAVESVVVEMVWDPPWEPAMMAEAAKQQLGWRR